MWQNKKSFLIIILSTLFLTSGCTLSLSGNNSEANSSGVFKSYDYGQSWQISNSAEFNNKKINLNNVNVRKIVFDYLDHKKIYLASEKGVWYSEDAGNNWVNILANAFVYDLALDQQKSGIIYVSLGQKIYKSLDLGANWQQLFVESRQGVYVGSIATDPNNNLVIYFGSSKGELYKTNDGGASWGSIYQNKKTDVIKKILLDPKNNKIMYLGLTKEGIIKTSDAGNTWLNIKENYTNKKNEEGKALFRGSANFYDLIFDPTQSDTLLYASAFGILKTEDGGLNWKEIKLLTPSSGTLIINSLAINPKDNTQIFYATDSAFYRSSDSGQTWIANSLPSNKAAATIQIDPQTTNVLYLGMTSKTKN